MLFEVRGQVLYSELCLQFLPDGVDAGSVLVGADGQGGGEPVKAVVPRVLRRAAHPQPVADGAAAAALRLVFQPGYGGVELLRVVSVLHHGHPQRVGCRHELLQLLAPAVILCRRPCVGVIVQHRDLKIPAQLFQHGTGTGAAAGVEQKPRVGIAKGCQHGVHLLGIVALCCHWYHPLL